MFLLALLSSLRKPLSIASQAWGIELIMHSIANSALVSGCTGIQRVFSSEEEKSGAGVIPLQRTRGPTRLNLDVLSGVVKSFFSLGLEPNKRSSHF